MDKERGEQVINSKEVIDSHKEFIKNGETVDVGTFEDFLRENPLKKIINENPECFDLPLVIASEIERFSNYPGVSKTEFTGSMARVALGFGTMERYYEGKKGMEELLTHFSGDDSDEEIGFIKSVVTGITKGSLDMDFCFRLDGNNNLFDLYDSAVKDHASLPNFSSHEGTIKLKNDKGEVEDYPVREFKALSGGKYDTLTRLEPIPMGPDLMKMTMYVSINKNGEKKELVHLDLTLFPKDGIQAEKQGRSGGRTLASQDKGRMEMKNIEGKLHLIKTPDAVRALYNSDEIDVKGKKITRVAELAMRASRIALIGFPEKLDININNVNTLFHPKSVFAIRKRMENYRLGIGKKNISEKDFKAAIGDMILSFNYDPYATLQVMQDLQFPELSDLSSNDWKKLFLNKNLNLATESDGFFVDPVKRSLTSVSKDQKEYRERKLSSGFVMVLKALHDIKGGSKEFNFDESVKSFFFGEKPTINIRELKGKNTSEVIKTILGAFNGGLTEREIHKLGSTILGKELSMDEFRGSLLELKKTGGIGKRLEKIRVNGKDKTVTFYATEKVDSKTNFYGIGRLISSEWKDAKADPSINRAVKFFDEKLKNHNRNYILLISGLQLLAKAGIVTLESLRSLSGADFSDIHDSNKSNEMSKDEFLIVARTLQIISEDILKLRS